MRNREEKKFDETRETFRNKDGVFKTVGVLTPGVVKQLLEDFEAFKAKLEECEAEGLTIDKILVRFNTGVAEERDFLTLVKSLVWMDKYKSFFWTAPGGLIHPKSPVQYGFWHPRSQGGTGTKTRNANDPKTGVTQPKNSKSGKKKR